VEAAGIEPASASPLPSVLHAYPVYCFNQTLPDRQGRRTASPCGFNELARGEPRRDPMRYDARNLNASARLQSDGTLLGIKQRVRSCRRWQLCGLQLDLRGPLPLGMPLRFRDPRRNQVAPFGVCAAYAFTPAAATGSERAGVGKFNARGLSDGASGAACRVASRVPSPCPACRAASCPWRGRSGISRGPSTSTA